MSSLRELQDQLERIRKLRNDWDSFGSPAFPTEPLDTLMSHLPKLVELPEWAHPIGIVPSCGTDSIYIYFRSYNTACMAWYFEPSAEDPPIWIYHVGEGFLNRTASTFDEALAGLLALMGRRIHE